MDEEKDEKISIAELIDTTERLRRIMLEDGVTFTADGKCVFAGTDESVFPQ